MWCAFFSPFQNGRQDSLTFHPISNRDSPFPWVQPSHLLWWSSTGSQASMRTRDLINCHLTPYCLTIAHGSNPGSCHLGKCGEPLAHPKLNALFLKWLPRLGKAQLSAQFQANLSFSHPGHSLQCLAALSPGVALFRKTNFVGMESFLDAPMKLQKEGWN